jgi:hypothetical protein
MAWALTSPAAARINRSDGSMVDDLMRIITKDFSIDRALGLRSSLSQTGRSGVSLGRD